MHIGFCWESHKERGHQEDLHIGRTIILKWIWETGWGGIDWIDPAEDMDQWRAFENMVINLQVPSHIGKFLCGWVTGDFSRTQLHSQSIKLVRYRKFLFSPWLLTFFQITVLNWESFSPISNVHMDVCMREHIRLWYFMLHSVTSFLTVKIVEPEEAVIAMQLPCKHALISMDTYTTLEEP